MVDRLLDENPIAMLERYKNDAFYEITEKLIKFIGAISPEVLNMKIRDLRMLNNLGLEFDYSKIEDKISKLGQVAEKYERKANILDVSKCNWWICLFSFFFEKIISMNS